jgi:large subunit ribosomal protein L13
MRAPSDHKISTIDAVGKPLGRLASITAQKLMGKESPSYVRNKISGGRVRIINLKQAAFSGKKMRQKIYYRHTGYIGHLKEEKLAHLWKNKPQEVFRRAVCGMLPKNKLRNRMLKRLEIKV